MSTIPLLRVFGFEIRVHLSWAIILAVVAVSVAAQIERLEPTTGPVVRWLIGGIVAGSLLVSAIAHELGHAVMARRRGSATGSVVVYFFGAAANPSVAAARPRDEIAIALAGPAVSLGLGLLLLIIGFAAVAAGTTPFRVIGEITGVIGLVNLLLGAFNLLPAFPLDGGRVVRGLAWARSGKAEDGLRVAARVGRLFGLGMAIGGIVLILVADPLDGLMVALCGWFLASSATVVSGRADLDARIGDMRVGEVMDRLVQGVPPGLTIDTFAGRVLDGSASPSLPVVRGRDLLGVIGVAQLRRIRRDRWATTRAEDLMVGSRALPIVDSQTLVSVVLEMLQRSGLDGLPVVDAGALAGVVTRRGVSEALRARASAQGALQG